MPGHVSWSERVKQSQPLPKWTDKGKRWLVIGAVAGGVVVLSGVFYALFSSIPGRVTGPGEMPDTMVGHLVEFGVIESSIMTPVYTRTSGEVVWLADEGTLVEKDDPIMTLDDTDRRARLEEQERQIVPDRTRLEGAKAGLEAMREIGLLSIRRAEVRLARAEWELEALKLKPTRRRLAEARLSLKVAEMARDRATRDYKRSEELASRGLTTSTDLRQKRVGRLDGNANAKLQEIRYEAVKRGPTELELEAARLKIAKARLAVEELRELRKADIIVAEKKVEVAELRLLKKESYIARLREELADCIVRSPVSGRVAFVDAWKGSAQMSPIKVGETCRRGQRVARISDPGNMRATVLVNEVDALHLIPGMLATVRLTAYPGVKLSGRVGTIGARAMDRNERLGRLALRKAGRAGVNVVEVRILLDEQPTGLRGGHTATVTIDLGTAPAVGKVGQGDPSA